MNRISHWGWTLILLGIYLIILVATNVWYMMQSYMDILDTLRYLLLPGILEIVITGLVGALCWLVGKNLFIKPNDAFFLPVSCILLVSIIMHIAWPALDFLFNLLSGLTAISLF